MSTYHEFQDIDGLLIKIASRGTDAEDVYRLSITQGGQKAWADMPKADAPAVALAILEAAGVRSEGDTHDHSYASHVIEGAKALRKAINIQSKRAEREAEDAKVQEWLDARNAEYGTIGDHWTLDDAAREGYRASKAFWEKHLGTHEDVIPAEIVEPQVLQYGDTCQDLDAKWRTQQGYSVEYDPNYAQWEITAHVGPVIRAKTIDRFSAAYFPMTEVL